MEKSKEFLKKFENQTIIAANINALKKTLLTTPELQESFNKHFETIFNQTKAELQSLIADELKNCSIDSQEE